MGNRIISRYSKSALPYLVSGGISLFLLAISRKIADPVVAGWLGNISASFIWVPLGLIGFDWLKGYVDRSLRKELFDYVKKDVDGDILSSLSHINKVFDFDVANRESFLKVISMSESDIKNRLNSCRPLGFQIYKNWRETKDLFSSVLRNPMTLQVFTTEQLTTLIQLLRAIANVERELFSPDNFECIGTGSEKYQFVKGDEVSKFNISHSKRYILLKIMKEEKKMIVSDFGDFEDCYDDRLLNEYKLSDTGKKSIQIGIIEVVRLVNLWLEQNDHTFVFDSKLFRPQKKTE